MESRTKNTKRRDQLEAMVRKCFAGTGLHEAHDAVLELKDGWFNAAYALRLADGRDVVLKIAPAADVEVMRYERNIMATEVATMRLVSHTPGIPVPRVLFSDSSREVCDSDCFFTEKLEGRNLAHVYDDMPAGKRAVVDREAGAIIRKINGITGSYFGLRGNPDLRSSRWRSAFAKILESVLDDATRKSVVFDYTGQMLRAAVARHIGTLDEVATPTLVHWDAWKPNFFVNDGHVVGIIDFERLLWADPLIEAQFRPLCWEGVTESMSGYGKTEFTDNEVRRCWLYLLHLALVMHGECYYRNYGTDEIFKKSRELSASAMTWLQQH
jgi:aminoglycoside phosphotransferase (APT) family kinase protein